MRASLLSFEEWLQFSVDSFHGQKMDLFDTLNELGQRINRWYPYINYGGCCVFAALVGQELLARNIRARVIIAQGYDHTNVEEVRQKVKNIFDMHEWQDNGVSFSHVGLEFHFRGQYWHYDTNGVHKKSTKLDHMKINPGRLTVADAKILADKGNDWNDVFDRRSIPRLRRHIKKFFAAKMPLTNGR